MDDDTQIHLIWVGAVVVVIVTIVICITAYQMAELRFVQPQIIQQYTWPRGGM